MVEEKLYPGVEYLNNRLEKIGNRFFFKAMRRALLLVFPLTIVGAVALCAVNFPVKAVQDLIDGQVRQILQLVVDGTFGIASLAMLCSMSFSLGEMYNREDERAYIHPFLYVIVGMGCFFVLVGSSRIESFTEITSLSNSMLEAVISAGLSSWLLSRITRKRFRISVSGTGYDLFSMEVFSIVPACTIVIGLFIVLRLTVAMAGVASVHNLTEQSVLSIFSLVKGDFFTGILYVLLCQLLWFMGAHGPNVLHSINANVLHHNSLSNMASETMGMSGHVFTQGFVDAFVNVGGSGFTMSLVIALLLSSRGGKNRPFSILALLVCCFNINEPLLFGIPIILNPVYFLPFVFCPVILYLIAYAVCASGYIPLVMSSFHWTAPIFVSGYHVSGGWTGVVLQAALLAVGVAIYLPFVRLSEKMKLAQFKDSMGDLVRVARSGATEKQGRFVNLPGMPGFAARSLGRDLIAAMNANEQLYVVFQPQIDIKNRYNLGAEALLRWNHPRYGFISPEITVALAEDMECIEELSFFVLREACSHLEHWSESLSFKPYVSVNFTPSLITDEMTDKVLKFVNNCNISPGRLEIEITESETVTTRKATTQRLNALRRAGIRIAIDDFGMGHTSLRYLREMPVDKVKIDRSLTLESSRGVNMHIVHSILELCRKIDLKVIIEGVEDEEQLRAFNGLGATCYQGYYFSRPVSAEDCFIFFKEWTGQGERPES